ncbi:RNA polymerase I-specific transcription initiation factor-domain-containing protein [Microdochium bolleyi]|uniref:RNA polymerase I-specific transcription initiation factor-domain-containing protein n=1 Tax=Microdochium bolleyi TaxID=196109 RepID=A0A136IXF8_9PEZI|nr:RNA polymerase I-specific transcription initiation factor-domain-containing protein [Microdochium bolleyi]
MAQAADDLTVGQDLSSSSSYETDESGNERTTPWQGPASAWRANNAQEISNATALEEIRNRDLSVHLYNAFALKRRHGTSDALATAPVAGQDIDVVTGQVIQADPWVPPLSWTAWPLSTSSVPSPEFVRRQQKLDPAERLTIRMPVANDPGSALRDALAASILRSAKEHFIARGWQTDPGEDGGSDGADSDTSGGGRLSDAARKETPSGSARSKDGKKEVDQAEDENFQVPAVSADDSLSHDILAPSIRHIMSRLDSTLDALHNAQEAATSYLSEASDSDSAHSTRSRHSRQRPASRHPGQGQRKTALKPEFIQEFVAQWDPDAAAPETSQVSGGKAKPGRPRKKYPRQPEESDADYVLRVSRLRKTRVPTHMTLTSSHARTPSTAPETDASEEEGWNQTQRQPKGHPPSERKRKQLTPRDWTDVLSAACLGGFSAQVLDRAARRCADVFGQQMRLHTLEETRHDQEGWAATENYRAGMSLPPVVLAGLTEDDDIKRATRQLSHAPSSAAAESDADQGSCRGRASSRSRATPARSRSASASASASAGRVFACKVVECPRFKEPFSRQTNMVRHMKQVHNMKIDVDVDSEDEMHGAVHVDGFMKPIRVRPGWRRVTQATPARDMQSPRKRKRGPSKATAIATATKRW